MGKYEVLEYLEKLRACGDHAFYKYSQIHNKMRSDGLKYHYSGVWRSVLCLYRDGMLEVEWEGTSIKRNPKFRAKKGT